MIYLCYSEAKGLRYRIGFKKQTPNLLSTATQKIQTWSIKDKHKKHSGAIVGHMICLVFHSLRISKMLGMLVLNRTMYNYESFCDCPSTPLYMKHLRQTCAFQPGDAACRHLVTRNTHQYHSNLKGPQGLTC